MRQIVFVPAALLVTALLILFMVALIGVEPPPVVRTAGPVERIALAPVEREEPAPEIEAPPQLVAPPDPSAALTIPTGYAKTEPRRADLKPYELVSHGAIPLFTIEPAYPTEALESEVSGRVRIEFTINPDGTVSDATVVEAEPRHGVFDHAAMRALHRSRFLPKTKNGVGVPSRAEWTFHFKLVNDTADGGTL